MNIRGSVGLENNLDYNEIYLEQALEFVDLVFNNNLDKIYFLRQYLKSFNTCKEQPVKQFTL